MAFGNVLLRGHEEEELGRVKRMHGMPWNYSR
jgi:hypothetical protein